jgi:SulP family sulfate permease
LFLLLAMLLLAPILGHIPMAGMAALLLVVAWNMSDATHFIRITRIAPRSDVAVLFVCFGLTVVYDMVIAVGVGVVFAALLFMRRMVEISGAEMSGGPDGHMAAGLPPGVVFYDVAGPLFFGAAEKALDALTVIGEGVHTVIINMDDVPAIDATGLVALESAIQSLNASGIKVVLIGVRPQPRRALTKAGFVDRPGKLEITDETVDTVTRFIESGGESDRATL